MSDAKMTAGDTPARRRAFAVLVDCQSRGKLARESNVTDEAAGYVYWQSARWLIDSGFAYYPSGSTMLALTALGRRVAGIGEDSPDQPYDAAGFDIRRCRECGCLDVAACDSETLGACWWVEADLCCACHPDVSGDDWEHPPREITDRMVAEMAA